MNNFLALLTPFFFYSIGGWLVIVGDMTVGSLIAVLGAYKDVSAPWKMLLGYYQRKEDARIKYEQLIEKFEPLKLGLIEKLEVVNIENELGDWECNVKIVARYWPDKLVSLSFIRVKNLRLPEFGETRALTFSELIFETETA